MGIFAKFLHFFHKAPDLSAKLYFCKYYIVLLPVFQTATCDIVVIATEYCTKNRTD